jgi:hypothetical protein
MNRASGAAVPWRSQRWASDPLPARGYRAAPFPANGDFIIRLEYTDLPQYHRRFGYSSRGTGEGWWMVDWPDAEDHFTMGAASGAHRLRRAAASAPSPTNGCSITPDLRHADRLVGSER